MTSSYFDQKFPPSSLWVNNRQKRSLEVKKLWSKNAKTEMESHFFTKGIYRPVMLCEMLLSIIFSSGNHKNGLSNRSGNLP